VTTLLLSALLFGLFLLVAIPLAAAGLAIGAALWLVAQILVLPFRLPGWGIGLGLGMIFIVAKVLLFLALAAFMMLALVVGFLLLMRGFPRRSRPASA
jgi:hypothetical protein